MYFDKQTINILIINVQTLLLQDDLGDFLKLHTLALLLQPSHMLECFPSLQQT